MRELSEPLGTMAVRGGEQSCDALPLDSAPSACPHACRAYRPMYCGDRHRQISRRRRNFILHRGAQTVARAPPEHRGEHTLPVEHIARRPRSSGRHPARPWWSSKSLQVDDQKAVTAPSLPTPSSACITIRSGTFLSLAQRSSFSPCDF